MINSLILGIEKFLKLKKQNKYFSLLRLRQ
jgi:hypothetical protein